MRVLHVINTVEIGGGGEHLLRLTSGLRDLGFDNRVVAGRDGPYGARLRDAGTPVTVLGRMGPGSVARLAQAFLRTRPDLVHLHGSRAGLLGVIAGQLVPSTRFIYTAHAFSFKRHLPVMLHACTILAERLTCRLADAVICLSQEDVREAARLGVAMRRIEVIPNGIDPAPFAAARGLRDELGIRPGVPVVGMIGRLVPDKDPLTFVRTAAQVSRRLPEARFLLIGDGPLRRVVEEEAHALGLDERLTFTGLRDDIPDLLATLDVVVLTSRWEGLPLIVLEAMASGRAIVCSRIPTLEEVVGKGGTGRLVAPGDAAGFADAIVALCTDRPLREALGAAAREYVARAFPLSRMIEQTAALYAEVLRAARHPGSARTTPDGPRA